ncbi:anthranilate synthase [Bosea sp. PAMC 26642]|uniref:anthranilate synthase n=1 Tax=Bosea sp. (strain PAMC 26642) TaxID=1792307 RepID=UPI00076FEAD2|nr:anthranilate synthase [Bosea sp. PAMC 26642]AMJ61445.1 anthranilate synthase [Bosea sp. PAMC 26642]
MDHEVIEGEALRYRSAGGVNVDRSRREIGYATAISDYVDALDTRRGAIFSSNYEFPGRYRRWDTAIVDPPLVITVRQRDMCFEALNQRGEILLRPIVEALRKLSEVRVLRCDGQRLELTVAVPDQEFSEEDRSRIPSVFTVLRAVVALFSSKEDSNLGLYGAFGYDLAFQFDPIELTLARPAEQRDLVLFIPDEICVVDHYTARAWVDRYEFSYGESTVGLSRGTPPRAFAPSTKKLPRGDHEPGEYARLVERAKGSFKRGDLFEVVPGQIFYERCDTPPSAIFRHLAATNPSPYSFFINLGEAEYLVGASPEMFVRVTGRRIETCPIAGTIKRSQDAISDSEQVIKLLNSKKDEAELTMCSDVDRNDKSRICEPGSVRVIGRRQIEMYSRLIHTVDHIEGRLRDGMDAFDGFLSHAWAVTVTGAPKLWAMRFIEENEKSARAWYGGAVGMMFFNGDMNTGLTLRTVRIKDGVAEVRAGATLLFDSDPADEEAETELKASAMIAAIREAKTARDAPSGARTSLPGAGLSVLLVDHEDSFVHTLGNYFRQTGATVFTVRTPVADAQLDRIAPDLLVLSPGPGRPSDFDCAATIDKARSRGIPIFGVCLGLQALAEAYGGKLEELPVPVHGKPSRMAILKQGRLFQGLPDHATVGRYHSLHVERDALPRELIVTAMSEDGVVMAIEHESEPVAAVQFHPESIMTLGQGAGQLIVDNVVGKLARQTSSGS